MNANAPMLITLSCPSCGAKLEILPNLDCFACSYCGQEHIVNRKGGTISLSPVVEAIHQVKTGVDKTAAELAIVRLRKDISDLKVKRQNILDQHPWHDISSFSIISTILGVIFLCPSLLAGFLNKSFFYFLIPSIIILLIGVIPIIKTVQNRRNWKQSTAPR